MCCRKPLISDRHASACAGKQLMFAEVQFFDGSLRNAYANAVAERNFARP
jgi:hypothetical protein